MQCLCYSQCLLRFLVIAIARLAACAPVSHQCVAVLKVFNHAVAFLITTQARSDQCSSSSLRLRLQDRAALPVDIAKEQEEVRSREMDVIERCDGLLEAAEQLAEWDEDGKLKAKELVDPGRFRIYEDRRLGKGSFGEVWSAKMHCKAVSGDIGPAYDVLSRCAHLLLALCR